MRECVCVCVHACARVHVCACVRVCVMSESRLQAQEDIRGPLSELQQRVLPVIQEQIQGYRSKQLLGLGALFGEGDLQQLDGDPGKERQVVDKQVTALWDILLKHEQERSVPLASAVNLYLRHSGIKLRESRPPGLAAEKDRWLTFFPKAKKLSSTKRDAEDRKRNPILKYIGSKPRGNQPTSHVPLSPSQVRPGNVRNIIQQFENKQPDPAMMGEEAGLLGLGFDGATQRLSTSSLGEQTGSESPAGSVRLGRSESLKARGEGRCHGAGAGGEAVPRSHSDVDMEDYGAERPLHHSNSSSTSSNSARSLENSTPPYTPCSRRRSVETPVGLLPGTPALDEDSGEFQNWQEMVDPQTLVALGPCEVDRQAVIYELYTTEASHLRTLRVLDQVFFQKLRAVLSTEQLACIFPNLPQVYSLHASLCESMKKLRESPIVLGIGDIMLGRFEGFAGAEFQEQVSLLCSRQSQALELIKNKQRKDPQFTHIIQECEASPHCRRLQLKDLLVSEMQRLTKYPLLLENIIKHSDSLSPDLLPLQKAQACCRGILQAVNEVVRETEHKQRLIQYQRQLDLTPLEKQANPVVAQFKNLDLTTRKMIHEGPLTWRVSKDKAIEVLALLLSDLLVLLQRGPDERLILRCPSRWLVGGASGDLKSTSCPVVRLDSLLVRSVATDNKALYLISASEGQIYELAAGTSSEKNIWKDLLERSVLLASASSSSSSDGLELASASALKSGIYRSESCFSEDSVCIETNTANEENQVSMTTAPVVQAFLVDKEWEGRGGRVAEAALQDVETLRHLIFRDLGHDGWSHDSDDVPTNDTANESCLFTHGEGPGCPELSPRQREDVEVEAGTCVQVVRKAKGTGSASIPDDITGDDSIHSNQSDSPKAGTSADGNTFYLVLPQELGGTQTEEASTSPPFQGQHQDTPSPYPLGQSQDENDRQAVKQSQSQLVVQRPLIGSVEEIFNTIEQLMEKLQQLREIEAAHYQLLLTLTDQPANHVSGDNVQTTPTDERTSIEQRGKDCSLIQPEIQSTGF
ncbi:rho guanine nucleotide exchange factor 11 [Anguilla rostrata]|uniref:rho guanine nucleotide exchange factor 11 n=1 Tax=Anguilla rostrata TaxID=7938 RepID=UPI0030D236C2